MTPTSQATLTNDTGNNTVAVDDFRHRFPELDGLRGIASLIVGLFHGFCLPLLIPTTILGVPVVAAVEGVISGAVAVDLFFIMSGFFLCGMLDAITLRNLPTFYIRRYVRLIPPAAASLVLIYIFAKFTLRALPETPNAGTDYFLFYADNHIIALKTLVLNFLFIRHTLNPPLWTIRQEILISSLFPLVFFLKNTRAAAWYKISLLPVFLLIALLLDRHQKLGLDVFHYLYMFYAGALIRDYGHLIRQLPNAWQYILCTVAIAGLITVGESIPTYDLHPIMFDIPVTLFGIILITLLSHGTIPVIRGFMNGRGVQFLGRISYSFYLINWLCVMGTTQAIIHSGMIAYYGVLPAALLLTAVSTLMSLIGAYWLYVTIEKPAVRLSRYLGIISRAPSPTTAPAA